MSDLGHNDMGYGTAQARAKLASWFREAAAKVGGYDEYTTCLGLTWRVNRGPKEFYGVWERYPILPPNTDGMWVGHLPVWDEHGWPAGAHPTEWQLESLGVKGALWLDIALQHKGYILHGIQLTDGMSSTARFRSRRMLRESGIFSLLRMPVAWVLAHEACPTTIPVEFNAWGVQ